MAARWVGYGALVVGAGAAGAAVALYVSGGSSPLVGGAPAASTAVASALPRASTDPATCGAPTSVAPAWPVATLADLPMLRGAVISSVQQQDGTLAVQFGIPDSFVNVAARLRTALPSSGFVLFGGDQESYEADVRFINGSLTGGFKLVDVGHCYSRGILAVVDPSAPGTSGAGTPLPTALSTQSPASRDSPSPAATATP